MNAMEAWRIWLLCVVAAVAYGIIHDQITARVCVEYFSVAHPTILPFSSPTLLGLQWGVLATWWVGATLGVLLAAAARAGSRPKLTARNLRYPVCILLMLMGLLSLASGALGYVLAKHGIISLQGWLSTAIPPDKHARFMADWWAHSASYLTGVIGGMVLSWLTFAKRRHRPQPMKS
jgi:membrane associated rhomboid family serine protease